MSSIDPTDTKELVLQATQSDEEKLRLLGLAEVSLWLDTYDDIFSDFDPRAYSQRALSDDFLAEAKRAVRDKQSGMVELQFLMPADKRNKYHEATIKRRLREHFHKHLKLLHKETNGVIRNGAFFAALGVTLMLTASFIMFRFDTSTSMILSFIIVLLEPGGWFLFWEGMDSLLFEWKKLKPEIQFYEKMAKCNITFMSY